MLFKMHITRDDRTEHTQRIKAYVNRNGQALWPLRFFVTQKN